MAKFKKFLSFFNKRIFAILGCVLLVAVCAISLFFVAQASNQQTAAEPLSVKFVGEYKIAEGEWQPFEQTENIPSTQGDVIFKGQIIKIAPDGSEQGALNSGDSINFYLNHIGCEIIVGEGADAYVFNCEIPETGKSSCGQIWATYVYTGNTNDILQITLKNPHSFGNQNAVNQFIEYATLGDISVVEERIVPQGQFYRIIGIVVMAVALALFCVALVSSLLKIKQSSILSALGGVAFFVGALFAIDTLDVFLWNNIVAFNTYALQFCAMLVFFFIGILATTCLTKKRKSVATVLNLILSFAILAVAIICTVISISVYDTVVYWGLLQSVLSLVYLICCIAEFPKATKPRRLMLVACVASFIAGILDVVSFVVGFLSYAICSKIVFILTFIISIFFAIKVIPQNYRASLNKKELEQEVQQSHVSIMLSQIKPHFLYNSLTSIAELCEIDAKKAQAATIEFSEYLRGNMSAVNKKLPIPFATEYKHLQSYLTLEKIRFGDSLHIVYDIKETAFELPALTVQPLVENAIKHGIRKAKKSGRVKIATRSDKKNYYVIISDDGVGFDAEKVYEDGKEHIGLANVKSRLQSMCNGTLTIKSQIGAGTTVTVTIPKEKK